MPNGITPQDPQRALSRIKWISTLLLVTVAILYVVARRYEHQHAVWPVVVAFSEAAVVGALADWFAVVALFRHPLGIPLPHTAIIPRSKQRIADNLAAFIVMNFLRTEAILLRIRSFDPAAKLAAWLAKPESAEVLGSYGIRAISYGLRAMEDQRIHRFIFATVVSKLEQIDFASLGGQLLDTLTQGGRHQQLLNEAIHQLRAMLDEETTQDKVAALIAREFEDWRKYLMNVVPVDAMIGSFSARKLIHAVSRLLDEVDEDPGHPLRARFDAFVADFIVNLKTDPAFRSKGEEIRDQVLKQPELAAYLRDLWEQLRNWLERDLHSPQSSIRARIVAATLGLGAKLRDDPETQSWINEQILAAAVPLCEENRERIGRFISDQVRSWDERYMAQQLELNIGRDLQFIRINGTLIGGLVGLVLYGYTALIGASLPA
jgi:uncharacterized membrane-anchored protein YjiN (DUF445 family)